MSTVTPLRRRRFGEGPYIPAAVHPDVKIVRLAQALASEGLAMSNLPDGRLLIHPSPHYQESGEVPYAKPVPSFLRWSPPDSPEAA